MTELQKLIEQNLLTEHALCFCGERDQKSPIYASIRSALKRKALVEQPDSASFTMVIQTNRLDTFEDLKTHAEQPTSPAGHTTNGSAIIFSGFKNIYPLEPIGQLEADQARNFQIADETHEDKVVRISSLLDSCETNSLGNTGEWREHPRTYGLFHIPKERVVLDHWLALAQSACEKNSKLRLQILGSKSEGIKSLGKRLKSQAYEFLNIASVHKEKFGEKDLLTIELKPLDKDVTRHLYDQIERYHALREFHYAADLPRAPLTVCTKPGVYGGEKADAGSSLLIEYLCENIENLSSSLPSSPYGATSSQGNSAFRVLDLGCGNGVLSAAFVQLHFQSVEAEALSLVATDNNADAIIASERTVRLAISAQRKARAIPESVTDRRLKVCIVASNAAENLMNLLRPDTNFSPDEKFHLILCNPPFHQGFTTNQDLHSRFFHNAYALLAEKGILLLVVNRFLAVEEKLSTLHFASISTVSETGKFKVIQCVR